MAYDLAVYARAPKTALVRSIDNGVASKVDSRTLRHDEDRACLVRAFE